MIESAGATSALRQLLNSRNEGIASYAATVLYSMSDQNNRNRDMYGNSMQINSSMYGCVDQNQWGGPGHGDITDLGMMCDEPFMDPY